MQHARVSSFNNNHVEYIYSDKRQTVSGEWAVRNKKGEVKKKGGADAVKVTLSAQEKLKGIKYSTIKNRREPLIHRIKTPAPWKESEKRERDRERLRQRW